MRQSNTALCAVSFQQFSGQRGSINALNGISKTGRSLQNFLSKYFRKFEPAREVSTCHVLYWSYSPIVFDRVQVQLSLTLLLRLEDFFHSYPN